MTLTNAIVYMGVRHPSEVGLVNRSWMIRFLQLFYLDTFLECLHVSMHREL